MTPVYKITLLVVDHDGVGLKGGVEGHELGRGQEVPGV